MTAMQIFELALSNISQVVEESEDLLVHTPAWLNILLQEVLPYENANRKYNGLQMLEKAPIVTNKTLDEEILYDDVLCRIALPYGLCACFYYDDDNNYRQADFRARYVNALAESEKAEHTYIFDDWQEEVD